MNGEKEEDEPKHTKRQHCITMDEDGPLQQQRQMERMAELERQQAAIEEGIAEDDRKIAQLERSREVKKHRLEAVVAELTNGARTDAHMTTGATTKATTGDYGTEDGTQQQQHQMAAPRFINNRIRTVNNYYFNSQQQQQMAPPELNNTAAPQTSAQGTTNSVVGTWRFIFTCAANCTHSTF